MDEESTEYILKNFPGTRYYPRLKLTTWHPRGILDEALAENIIAFIKWEEYIQDAPFDRYTDLSGVTEIRLRLDHVIETARRRRLMREPVKSALFGDNPVSFEIAQMYERLMEEAIMIRVRAFGDRKAAGEWLEVPPTILEPPAA
jgi:hypothetical protein